MKSCKCIENFSDRLLAMRYTYGKIYRYEYYKERCGYSEERVYKVYFGVGEYNFMSPDFFNERFVDNNKLRKDKLMKIKSSL